MSGKNGAIEAAVFFAKRDFRVLGMIGAIPGDVVFDEGLENCQELSQAGGDTEFEGLSLIDQSFVEGLDRGVAA